MLELQNVSLFINQDGEPKPLLADVTMSLPRRHFAALIGASGCGKSTLLKLIAGVATGTEEGEIYWDGHDVVAGEGLTGNEIAYVPQFSIAHEELTVDECVSYTLRLRSGSLAPEEIESETMRVLAEVGLADLAEQRVKVLSGGQRRRLSLAMEIVSHPSILLADEVTSGLDPSAEDGVVRLLRDLSRSEERLVISVTHSLRHLAFYDSVIVLTGGRLAYHGSAELLGHYFSCEDDPQKLYDVLATRDPDDWARSWKKHRGAFLDGVKAAPPEEAKASIEQADPSDKTDQTDPSNQSDAAFDDLDAFNMFDAETSENTPTPHDAPKPAADIHADIKIVSEPPSSLSQFFTLLERRVKIFTRDTGQLWLQVGLILLFPLLAAVPAWNGLPDVKNLAMDSGGNLLQQAQQTIEVFKEWSFAGSVVSGVVMLQVVLLTLMGASNAMREIATERLIAEKEKLSGLSPLSYIASKAVFLGVLVFIQAFVMAFVVKSLCGFPGDFATQLFLLVLVNAAMTAICLAISAWAPTAEQATIASICVVGFQLPLSGAVLALPAIVETATRWAIPAYWSWSGILETLRNDDYYLVVTSVVQTSLSPMVYCIVALVLHIFVGLYLAYLGISRTRSLP